MVEMHLWEKHNRAGVADVKASELYSVVSE